MTELESIIWFLIFGALFYFMMRYGCGAIWEAMVVVEEATEGTKAIQAVQKDLKGK